MKALDPSSRTCSLSGLSYSMWHLVTYFFVSNGKTTLSRTILNATTPGIAEDSWVVGSTIDKTEAHYPVFYDYGESIPADYMICYDDPSQDTHFTGCDLDEDPSGENNMYFSETVCIYNGAFEHNTQYGRVAQRFDIYFSEMDSYHSYFVRSCFLRAYGMESKIEEFTIVTKSDDSSKAAARAYACVTISPEGVGAGATVTGEFKFELTQGSDVCYLGTRRGPLGTDFEYCENSRYTEDCSVHMPHSSFSLKVTFTGTQTIKVQARLDSKAGERNCPLFTFVGASTKTC
ncbi:uncharacterized protein LOC142346312 isoform X2 [Convolutriloba macropyga]